MNTPPSSTNALRRLLLVLALVVGVVIYAYGWEITDIDLAETQRETRQASVARALNELLSPNVFDRERETQNVTVEFQHGCPENAAPLEQPAPTEGPYVVFSTTCGQAGDVVAVEGFNFRPNSRGAFRVVRSSGQRQPIDIVDSEEDEFRTDTQGHFTAEMIVPNVRGTQGSLFPIDVITSWPAGEVHFSQTSRDVWDKMVETIFLALMATTLALPISIVVSFFAAHNLMRDIRVPLGNILVGFALLPLGWALGAWALGALGRFGFDLGSGSLFNATPAVVLIGSVVASQVSSRVGRGGTAERLRGLLTNLAILCVVIFLLGLLGGLSTPIGDWLVDQGRALEVANPESTAASLQNAAGVLLGALGAFVETLSIIISSSLLLVGGLTGAYVLSATGVRLAAPLLRSLAQAETYVAGAVLGVISGAILMALLAWLGTQAALLALLTLTIAAILGGSVAAALYERLAPPQRLPLSAAYQSARTSISIVGVALAFVVTFLVLDVGAFIIDGDSPPPDVVLSLGSFVVTLHMAKAALIGAVLGGAGGALAGTHASFPVGMSIYNTTRTILNALRSIEPLIMGLVFVTWVGIGPFAGVLALTLHSIASLGKLYSEQIESIDHGPIEAIQATGATRLQTIIYAVVPQIIPPYIAFTMYRWDINVRMSTIIGFVGGGGIGFLLKQQIDLLQYRDAGVAVLAIAVVVSVLDYASAVIRERVI